MSSSLWAGCSSRGSSFRVNRLRPNEAIFPADMLVVRMCNSGRFGPGKSASVAGREPVPAGTRNSRSYPRCNSSVRHHPFLLTRRGTQNAAPTPATVG